MHRILYPVTLERRCLKLHSLRARPAQFDFRNITASLPYPPLLPFHPAAYRRSAGTKPVKFDFRHLCTGSSAPVGQIQRRACTRISNDPATLRYSLLPSSLSTVCSKMRRPFTDEGKISKRTNNLTIDGIIFFFSKLQSRGRDRWLANLSRRDTRAGLRTRRAY